MRLVIIYLLMSNLLLVGCTKNFTVTEVSQFKRENQHIKFDMKFSELNMQDAEELSKYPVGVFKCTNTLTSRQIITGFVDDFNLKNLSAKASLSSCLNNPANACNDSQYDVDVPHNVDLECYITFNSILKKTYQTQPFNLHIP